MHSRAEQVIEQHVARLAIARLVMRDHVDEDEVATQPQFRGGRRRLPRMIRLDRAEGDDRIRPLRQRFAHQEFELARLVPAGGEPRAVVALHIKRRAGWPQRRAQPVHPLQRRRPMPQFDARKSTKINHGVFALSLFVEREVRSMAFIRQPTSPLKSK
jgi:hypothetical protein